MLTVGQFYVQLEAVSDYFMIIAQMLLQSIHLPYRCSEGRINNY
jgi:hypothetical protein